MQKIFMMMIGFVFVFLTMDTAAQNKNIKTYPTASVTMTATDDGNSIWTGTGRGVVQINKATQETTVHRNIGGLRDTVVDFITMSPTGDIWAGTRSGVARFKNGVWQGWELRDKSGKWAGTVTAICFDSTGHVWIASGRNKFYPNIVLMSDTTHVIARFDGTDWEIYDKSDWSDNLRITNMMTAADGSVWAVGGDLSNTKGLVFRWKNGGITKYSSDKDALPTYYYYSSLVGLYE